jgi:predicted alpha/beta-fold hydrolase
MDHPHRPIAVLIHGLGGSHRSAYLPRMARRLNDAGWRVFRMDLRGAGAGVRLARRFYNAGCSDDIRAVVEYLSARWPGQPIVVAGFSLGGNIALKLAGESAEQPLPGLHAVVAVAPPVDLVRCSTRLARHRFYDAFFVRLLVEQVSKHQHHFADLPRIAFPRRLKLQGFDDIYTAPRWGYADALDYYQRASALPHMGAIRVPTYILTARDDPFIAVEPFEELTMPPSVEVQITPHGGHLGFLGADGAGGIRWAETQIVRWMERSLQR